MILRQSVKIELISNITLSFLKTKKPTLNSKRLKEIKSSNPNKHLRILVDSGGCSGFEYKFSLDSEIKPEDL